MLDLAPAVTLQGYNIAAGWGNAFCHVASPPEGCCILLILWIQSRLEANTDLCDFWEFLDRIEQLLA